jgi:hypothetical protein
MPAQCTLDDPFVELCIAGYTVKVSPEDVDRVLSRRWYPSHGKDRGDYLVSQKGPRRAVVTTYLHRFIMGATPDDPRVDHSNRDTMDCRRCNLRYATPTQNSANGMRTSHDGFKGVRLRCDGKRWTARIQYQGKGIHIGSFDTPESAARAYDAKARELFGPFACLNFSEEDAA